MVIFGVNCSGVNMIGRTIPAAGAIMTNGASMRLTSPGKRQS
jgi:hypothetical protein